MCIQCFHSASLQDIYKKTKTFTSIKYKEYIETLGSERVLCKKRGSLQKGYSFFLFLRGVLHYGIELITTFKTSWEYVFNRTAQGFLTKYAPYVINSFIN